MVIFVFICEFNIFQENAASMDTSNDGEFYPVKCDVSKEQDILDAFAWVKETFGGVDVLVNNAGISKYAFVIIT